MGLCVRLMSAISKISSVLTITAWELSKFVEIPGRDDFEGVWAYVARELELGDG